MMKDGKFEDRVESLMFILQKVDIKRRSSLKVFSNPMNVNTTKAIFKIFFWNNEERNFSPWVWSPKN